MAKLNLKPFLLKIASSDVPLSQRKEMMVDLLGKEDESLQPAIEEIFVRLASTELGEDAQKKQKMLTDILKALETCPMRPATFIERTGFSGTSAQHVMVALDNGDFGYVVAHDADLVSKLKLGDRIVLDAQAKILVASTKHEFQYGNEARLERQIDGRHIEVVTHQDDRRVLLANQKLIKGIESGAVPMGSQVVLSCGEQVALLALPKDDGLSHFRFLDRGPIPNVIVERDIGAPPKVIEQVCRHIREEMTRPSLRRRFKLRPCITRLLCGVSGTGKTLAVQAIHRQMYEIMAEVTGVPMTELPQRVFKFKPSQVLSMWLGQSDKNADRIFDEIEKVAETTLTVDGQEYQLPVLVVMEEADAIGRARGQDHDGIYDRIMTTILQRLDPNREGLSSKLVVFLSTTNEPHIVDPAFLRRIGGSVEIFGRLNQRAFNDILRKHVAGLPANNGNGDQGKAWEEIMKGIDHLLFDEHSDDGVVEMACSGGNLIKYRRDFLTGALIDRAVQEAASEAWEESLKNENAGITFQGLARSLDRQIQNVAAQLTPQNVSHYLDLPEGVRVSNLRRVANLAK